MYIAGRLRTGSRPSRTWMLFAVYSLDISVHLRRGERGDLDRRRHDLEGGALGDLVALATARGRPVAAGADLDDLAARALDHEGDLLLALGHAHADQAIVGAHLDHGDAAARVGEEVHLAGRAQEHVPLLGGHAHHVLVVGRGDLDDLVAVAGPGVPAAGARGQLEGRRQGEAQAVALPRP